MQEVVVYGVSFDMVGKQPIVLLKTAHANRFLPIWIGQPEAASIAMAVQGVAPQRPMTHDLIRDLLQAIGVTVTNVAITDLRDGTYYGWGTSRHGDIQAVVTIEAGRIVRAGIAQCLTRYSCSWIAALPPQVVQRQSAEVDYVSGATQSVNAFYYAILEALAQAK